MQRAKRWQVRYKDTKGQKKHVSPKLKTRQKSAERLKASYSSLQDYNPKILKGKDKDFKEQPEPSLPG